MRPLRIITIITTALALSSGSVWLYLATRPQLELTGTALEQARYVGDISLEHHELGQVSLTELSEGYLLLFFGFTRCPDVCPLTMARLQRIYQNLGEPDTLQIAMITVDPEHDTLALIQDYASGYHPDFLGLGGSNEAVASATKAFFVAAREAGDGQFIHTEAAFLVNPRGELILIYNPDKQRGLEADLRQLL